MRILLWHVHGSWTTAFVQGGHDYVLPVTPGRDEDGLGRARTWDWPASVREEPPERLSRQEIDVVVLQRPHEVDLAERWLGRRPGRDLPAVYLEHNTPTGDVPDTRHPMAGQRAIPVVHVTGYNELMWDSGDAPTTVIDHGIVDPGYRYSGEVARAAAVVNDPSRRNRFVGADLIVDLAGSAPVDLFGMRTDLLVKEAALVDPDRLRAFDLSQSELHREVARRRVYVHTSRWTSLGLSLLEAMHLGMPVVSVASTEAYAAVPPSAGVLVTRREDLRAAVRRFLDEPEHAREAGREARAHVLEHYGLQPFLRRWDELLTQTVTGSVAQPSGSSTGTPGGRGPA
jgi:glycosyltransferase involved in cell wall biosynthesis